MRYLLDSDILSDLYEQTSPDHQVVFRRFETLEEDDDLAVSILALYELEYGYANSFEGRKPSLRRRIENVRSRFTIYGLSDDSARMFGQIKKALVELRGLSKKASRYHNIDLMVAATAVTKSCILVGADSLFRDLQRFEPGLIVQNWRVEAP
ncbi:MAG TPA: type II toxin-antitoxin system VapC family toxin [Thermoanaerobaculia bacterium]|jgi:predicted nucleic acid-binding protein|nr:type II toxin-antitoxin system VapC family toxin [Thermoanaerobaculia bacterium]